MIDNYRKELVQVAAVCLAAAQIDECDTSSLGNDNEGVRGRFSLERLLNEVRDERRRQELKWGTRTGADATPTFWLDVLLEEIGEVAKEIKDAGGVGLCAKAFALGEIARQRLETR